MKITSILTGLLISAILFDGVQSQGSCGFQSDVVFLVDSSNSICAFSTTICSNYRLIRDFVENFITHFQTSITSGDLRVGCVVYSSLNKIYNAWTLNQYTTVSQLQTAAQSIPYDGGTTYTAAGLDYVVNNAMMASSGARTNYKKIVILLTDGAANDATDLASKISLMDNAGIERYVVGVTSSVNTQQMNDIATDPDSDHVFTANSFSDLVNVLLPTFQTQLCSQHAVTTTTAQTTTAVPTTTTPGPTTTTVQTTTAGSGPTTTVTATGSTGVSSSGGAGSTVPSVPVQPVTLINNLATATSPFNVLILISTSIFILLLV